MSNKKVIKIKNINKVYENKVHAIFDFNLTIKDKEFIVFVGPSGCGKSTTLRMIAGLEEISYGELNFDGKVMNAIPAKNRDLAMVFQNYALYPHMSVYKNMSNGLKLRKVSNEVIDKKIKAAAKKLDIEHYLNRKPKDLSGGQRQRVALGRAIVREPRLFLMDEPLSNLDAKLRGEMRTTIRNLHDSLGTTSIYVTHDQIEAMTMADRVVVMNDGFIEQVGTPDELYNYPANTFVANFIGTSEMNLIEGKIVGDKFISEFLNFKINPKIAKKCKDKKVILGVRPNDIYLNNSIVSKTHKDAKLTAKIKNVENLGERKIVRAKASDDSQEIRIILSDNYSFSELNFKKTNDFFINISKIHLFDKDTKYNLISELNEDTKKAMEVKLNRVMDKNRKHEIIQIQSGKKTVKEKGINLVKSGFKKIFKRK